MKLQVWLVCGGRQFGNLKDVERGTKLWKVRLQQCMFLKNTLDRLAIERSALYNPTDNWLPSDIKIIAGKATGADTCAAEWAVVNWSQLEEFPADWPRHGKAAGFHRNQQMLTFGKPTLGIAFPGGTGTADMVKRLKENKIETIEVTYKG